MPCVVGRGLLFRLGLASAIVPAVIAAPVFTESARAQDDDDGDFDDDSFDDDDDDGEPQPKVTAGGMYTKRTYPVTELERTLQVIGGMTEIRGGFDIDVGDQTAFETWRLRIEGRYGFADNVEGQFGANVTLARSDGAVGRVHEFFVGIESALYFEVVNARLLAAITTEDADPSTGAEFELGFDLIGGVPFRYLIKPNLAIVALDKVLTIHTRGGRKPDLTIGVGVVLQILSVKENSAPMSNLLGSS